MVLNFQNVMLLQSSVYSCLLSMDLLQGCCCVQCYVGVGYLQMLCSGPLVNRINSSSFLLYVCQSPCTKHLYL